jgi:hypothetical protein
MTPSKSLPARPSLDSLRKQARKLARDVAAGDADALARVRTVLPPADRPLTLRNAQLVIAREYGFAGWHDLIAEVSRRLGRGLEWAAAQARRVIHDNDVERLKQLLAGYPGLLTWHGGADDGGLLGFATDAYGDSFDPERERVFTRAACAELLIDARAIVRPSVLDGLIQSRARGLLQLFHRKGLLPRTLRFFAALGDLDAARAALDRPGGDLATVNDAFLTACRFEHDAVASLLLERSIALDDALGANVDGSVGRRAFLDHFLGHRSLEPERAVALGPWRAFVVGQALNAALAGDPTFADRLRQSPWLLADEFVWLQNEIISNAVLKDREENIVALLALDPAILRQQPPPASQAIEFALTYERTHLIPLLTRIWPLPDDLPHAAGTGDMARVKRWFDASGAPALGDLERHYPYNDPRARSHLHWEPPTEQQVLDVALAFAVVNRHFEIADVLLEGGADIDTNWSSHEPASLLHELVFHDNYESMRFLIDRGIDMTITDYRWNSTAIGWARYGKSDEAMARWLEGAERERAARAR